MTSSPAPSVEALLAHSTRVRDLARSLAGSGDLADEIEQETWLALLRHRPGGPLRGWLAKVMRNLLRQGHRRSLARRKRERSAARAEAVPDTGQLVERADTHRLVVEELLAVQEPYRTTILMRYFESLSWKEIARREGVSLGTIHSRHSRGLVKLRQRLERRMGRQRWAVLPALLSTSPDPTLGALIMKTKLVSGIAVVLVALGTIGLFLWLTDRPATAAPVARSAESAADLVAELPAAASSSADRRGLPPEDPEPGASTPQADTTTILHGRVLDADAHLLSGIGIQVSAGSELVGPVAETDARGAFELPARTGILVAVTPGWSTVLRSDVSPSTAASEHVVVVAPEVFLAGRVIDPYGAPLGGVDVSVELPRDFRSRFDTVLDRAHELDWRVRTDAAGGFSLTVPSLAGGLLVARLPGYDTHQSACPRVGERGLLIVLGLPDVGTAELELEGVVLDTEGRPLSDTVLWIGDRSARSGTDGTFHLGLESGSVPADRLLAAHAGYLPARIAAPGRDAEDKPVWPAYLTVILEGPPRSISGRVLDAEGVPLSGIAVWVGDPTELPGGGGTFPLLEGIVAGNPGEHYPEATEPTDRDGRFTIENLQDRDYRLFAMERDTFLRAEARVPAGCQDVELRMPADGLHERVAGRVVFRSGEPAAGVHVKLGTVTVRLGRSINTSTHAGRTTVTDADGRFELESVPKRFAHLRVDGENILPLRFGDGDPGGFAELGDLEDLEIVVSARCHFRIELASETTADRVEFRTATGEALRITRFKGSSRQISTSIRLDGLQRTDTLAVSDAAHWALLMRGEETIRRQLVSLVPGQVSVIRL